MRRNILLTCGRTLGRGVSGNSSDFTTQLDTPIQLDREKQYIVEVKRMNTWFSFYNISASQQNNVFRYHNGTSYVNVTIPDGNWSFKTLIEEIQRAMVRNGDYDAVNNAYYVNIYPNTSSYRVEITISNGYAVDFVGMGIREIFGWTEVEITDGFHIAPGVANITNGVNSILVHCSLVSGNSTLGSATSDVLFSYVPREKPSSSIEREPKTSAYVKLSTDTISEIRIYLTDQDNNPRTVFLNGEDFTLLLHLKEDRL